MKGFKAWCSQIQIQPELEKSTRSRFQQGKLGSQKFAGAVSQAMDKARIFISEHASVVAGVACGAIGGAITPIAAAPILSMVGFSSIGPVAGSLAAAIQSTMGSVAAGSSFAVAQSIAMGGAAVPASGIIIGGLIFAVAGLLAAVLLRRAMRRWKARRASPASIPPIRQFKL